MYTKEKLNELQEKSHKEADAARKRISSKKGALITSASFKLEKLRELKAETKKENLSKELLYKHELDRLSLYEFESYTGITFSHNMTGKMTDVLCLSTNCFMNKHCMKRYLSGIGVCAHCFAAVTEKMYPSVRENTSLNTEILTDKVLPYEVIPYIYTDIVRIESFGDLNNVTQAENYLRLAIVNKNVRFGWWTKNPQYIHQALQKYHKGKLPSNVLIVLSSTNLNKEVKVPDQYKYFISKVFTVYTKEYFEKLTINHESFINCGARSCKACQRCYNTNYYNMKHKQKTDIRNDIEYIKELLK